MFGCSEMSCVEFVESGARLMSVVEVAVVVLAEGYSGAHVLASW